MQAGKLPSERNLAGAYRLLKIARVLRRHGVLSSLRGGAPWPPPARVREAFEELGTVFIKFGQLLAVRRDLLPEAYTRELERLHDRAPVLAPEVVRAVLTDALGDEVEAQLGALEERPLAAASIAQVHAATLPGGRPVVVKVQRPGLERAIAEDIGALLYLAAFAESVSPRLRPFDPVGMVREFQDSLRRELDFQQEAENVRRFQAALREVPGIWIPGVVAELSAQTVLTLEYSPGVRVDTYAAQHPEAAPGLASAIADLMLRQVFEDGMFHADPHPGNVFVLPDGRICLHDFGMVGRLPEEMRNSLIHLLSAVVDGEVQDVIDAYLELGVVGDEVDRGALAADLSELLQQIREGPLEEISIGAALESLLRVGTRHRIRNPGPMLLLARAFFLTESLMRQLDPSLSPVEVFRREMQRVAVRRYAPERILQEGRRLGQELDRLVREAPGELRRTLRRLADGHLGTVRAPELESMGRRAGRAIERLTGGVASAALLVAGALLVGVGGWHRTVGDLLLLAGVAGTLVVALGALRSRS